MYDFKYTIYTHRAYTSKHLCTHVQMSNVAVQLSSPLHPSVGLRHLNP